MVLQETAAVPMAKTGVVAEPTRATLDAGSTPALTSV